MSSLFNYIENYGEYTFYEKEFNEVDNVILSLLTYIDFSGIVSTRKKYITLETASKNFFLSHSKRENKNNILAIRQAIKILDKIKNKSRYRNILLYNYCNIADYNEQFCAMCIKLNKDLIYVSYEGTDELISGWKEDFLLASKFPVNSQQDAIKYLNRSISVFDKKIIIGGHSKGGNLALISSIYTRFYIRNKIINIYSNDGPGILFDRVNMKKLNKVRDRFIHIIPDSSIIGLVLDCPIEDKIIKSNKRGIFAHDALTWQIDGNHFVNSTLCKNSAKFKDISTEWISEYTYEEKEKFINELFDIFNRLNIDSLLDIKNRKIANIFNLIKESNKIDNKSKKMLKDLFKLIFDDFEKSVKTICCGPVQKLKKLNNKMKS